MWLGLGFGDVGDHESLIGNPRESHSSGNVGIIMKVLKAKTSSRAISSAGMLGQTTLGMTRTQWTSNAFGRGLLTRKGLSVDKNIVPNSTDFSQGFRTGQYLFKMRTSGQKVPIIVKDFQAKRTFL